MDSDPTLSLCLLCLLIGIFGQTKYVSAQQSVKVVMGQADASMSMQDGKYFLKADVQTLAQDYAENWYFSAAVIDYDLPEPMSLAGDVNRVSLNITNPGNSNSQYMPMFRVLVSDQRGYVYAVGTRLGAKTSQLQFSDFPMNLQTYDWNINEMGRIDPWVMMRVKPETQDYYDPPQGQMKLVGFRLVLRGKGEKTCQLTVEDITPLAKGQKADPYWQIESDLQWINHLRQPYARYGRYGWGPSEPGPYLKATDLRLAYGKTTVLWEILDKDDWTVLASDKVSMDLNAQSLIQLPLLDTGTYRVKLHAITSSGQVQPRYLMYVVLRNSRVTREDMPQDKPLKVLSSSQSNVFTVPQQASLDLSTAQGGEVKWSLEAADGTAVANGQSTRIDLSEALKEHNALWLKAQLLRDGQVVDELDRVVGLRSAAPVMPVDGQPVTRKVKRFEGKLRRVKGDWNEGNTPIASDSKKLLKQFTGWLDDAVDTGYNIVELSAPWYDLNPLPGVYQFEYLDKLIALAQQRNLMVTLRIHPMIYQTPGYVDRQLMMDQMGFAHGLWNGSNSQLPSPASQSFRNAINVYLMQLAARYRNHPAVLGYSLESLFYDHDMIDMPWLGQFIDYSPAMRHGFIDWLKERYGDLAGLNKAYKTQYVHLEQIDLPVVSVSLDDDGRPMPHHQPLIHDWLKFKIDAITKTRMDWLRVTLKADPSAFLGIYNTQSSEFSLDTVRELGAVVTYGGMESQYPMRTRPNTPGRFEPSAKIARTAPLVDVGLTNLLMIDQPGMHGLFNYWNPKTRVADQPVPIIQAEKRLKKWFTFIDQITTSKPLDPPADRKGAYVISDETLLYEHGHLFYPRLDDYLKPFVFHVDQSDMKVVALHANDIDTGMLQDRPWVYVPYFSDLLSDKLVATLKTYVQQGGTLIMEAGSGKWSLDSQREDVLSRALGLGDWQSRQSDAPAIVGNWQQAGKMRSATLKLRTQPFNPPITTQPTPWIHNIAKGYLQTGTWTHANLGSVLAVSQENHTPILTQHTIGAGRVLAFGGVVDWLDSPGLLGSIQSSITGQSQKKVSEQDTDTQLIKREFVDGQTHFLVGRRFIGQSQIAAIKASDTELSLGPAVTSHVQLTQMQPQTKYQIIDLLNEQNYPVQTGEQLMHAGIVLNLKPGQAFVLKFEQE